VCQGVLAGDLVWRRAQQLRREEAAAADGQSDVRG
jgi:hypothetical protein